MAEPTRWPALLSAAHNLGLTPACFWRLSLKEWRALTSPRRDSLTRVAFEALAERYPDRE